MAATLDGVGAGSPLAQEAPAVQKLVLALENNARVLPSKVATTASGMAATLGASFDGDGRVAFNRGVTVLEEQVKAISSRVIHLADGVETAKQKISAADSGEQTQNYGRIVSALNT